MRFNELPASTFLIVSASESPGAALGQSAPSDFFVVVDGRGRPVALVTDEDLARAVTAGAATLLDPKAELPPTVVVGAGRDIGEVAGSQFMGFANLGARGLVLLDDAGAGVVGVVSFGALVAAASAGPLVLSATSGGGALGGDPTTPRAEVKCKTCGHVNTVPFIDRHHPPECQNTADGLHPLGV
jgi:hypothetical protein